MKIPFATVIHIEYPPQLNAMFKAAEKDFERERESRDRQLQEWQRERAKRLDSNKSS